MAHRQRIVPALRRVWFALLVSAIAVVFSEKLYWYVTGYGFFDLLIGYFFPSYMTLFLIDTFRVRRLAPLFLAAAVFGFVAEGVLVGTIYEGGPLGLFHISYTPLAWHAPLTILFGWHWLGRRLATGSWRGLVVGCALVGLLWGLWAMAWWLPENAADPALLAQGARLGQWPVVDFARHAFLFTAVVATSHWLLDRGGRLDTFQSSRTELVLVAAGLLFFFTGVLAATPWAPVKLMPILTITLVGLWKNRRHEPPGSLIGEHSCPARPVALLGIFAMPAAAVAVYAAASVLAPPAGVITLITGFGLFYGLGILGWLFYLVALILTIWRRNRDIIDPATNLDNWPEFSNT